MKNKNSSPWGFLTVCLIVGLVLARSVWQLSPVYLDPALRISLRQGMQMIADERGWLLSDMQLFCSLKDSHWTIEHHDHLRFETIREFPTVDSALPLCDAVF